MERLISEIQGAFSACEMSILSLELKEKLVQNHKTDAEA
jgi:hypothetical protein